MSRNINRVTLLGNLGQDPDVRQFPDGGAVVNFSLATNETWKDKNTGETKEKTQWHRIVVFGPGLIKVCQDYLKKGSRVFIEGTLENRSWTDKNGTERYTTEIVLRPYRGVLTLLDAKENGNGGNHADMPDDGYGPGPDDDEIPY